MPSNSSYAGEFQTRLFNLSNIDRTSQIVDNLRFIYYLSPTGRARAQRRLDPPENKTRLARRSGKRRTTLQVRTLISYFPFSLFLFSLFSPFVPLHCLSPSSSLCYSIPFVSSLDPSSSKVSFAFHFLFHFNSFLFPISYFIP